MPFPPTFTDVWDITTPPDTQLANLLGQDIRNLKNDIMQRMSLLSGTLANRPTPETVNATWGGSGYGLIYLATDTKQLFQWNGASWTDISNTLPVTTPAGNLFNSGGQIIQAADVTLDTIWTYTLPANTLGATNGVEVEFNTGTGVTVNGTIKVVIGGVTVVTNPETSPGHQRNWRVRFINTGATNANCESHTLVSQDSSSPNVVSATPAFTIDFTANQAIAVQSQKGAAGDTYLFTNFSVRKL